MEPVSDEQVEKLYALLLERLDEQQKIEAINVMAGPEQALADVCSKYDHLQEDDEKELQRAVQDYERTQNSLNRMESADKGGLDDESEIEAARIMHSEALAAMEACLSRRAGRSTEYAEAKADAEQQRLSAMRRVLEQFGSALQKLVPGVRQEPASMPSTSEPSTERTEAQAAQKLASVDARYEPLQSEHVDIIIRVPGSFKKMGIAVDETGIIMKAPGALFDQDYRILTVDGKSFRPGLQDEDGAHNVILRCKKADLLLSLSRMPARQIRGKALKLLQVQLSPDNNGFGIDLSEFNSVAGLAKGGAAANTDLRVGDIIVGADGVTTGARRVVEVLQRGKKSHIFTVVRPATMMPTDRPEEPSAIASKQASTTAAMDAAHQTRQSKNATRNKSDVEGDALKQSLAESLGRLQTQNEMLAAAPVVHFVRITPTEGTAITVEWATRMSASSASRFHLEWREQSQHEWSSSEASRNLRSTIVTKGNLKPDTAYKFRVRARAAESDEWGEWSNESNPIRPDATATDQLSTIAEESSEVMSAVSSLPASTRGGMGMDAVQALLLDQRQALSAEHLQDKANLEAELRAELEAVKQELDDWKAQFAEVAGNSLQAVLDAKASTRAEVMKEMQDEMNAVKELKAETDKALERIREAEAAAEVARADAESYKKRFDVAFEEAKEQCDKEANAKLNVIMRNASLELRDKVKFVEDQTDATVKRAVDEAVRIAEAKGEAAKREAVRELQLAHDKQREAMGSMIGAGAMQKIQNIQDKQDARVAHAVRDALAEAKKAAIKQEAAAVQSAVAAAVQESETKFAAREASLEQKIIAVTREMETRMSSMFSEEAARVLVAKAREEMLRDKDAAVQEAVALTERKAAIKMDKMTEGLSEKMKDAVRTRERQLLAEEGRKLKELADMDLKEQTQLVSQAGRAAARQWGSGNDEFEEEALNRTRPTTLFGPDDLLEAIPSRKKSTQKTNHIPAEGLGRQEVNKRDDDEESMVAPSMELVRLRARHAAEIQALRARQEADELMEAESDFDSASNRKEGRAKRAAEKEEMRKRQVAEAMAAGEALVNEERVQQALDDSLLGPASSTDEILALLQSPIDDGVNELTGSNPSLKSALEKVRAVEDKLREIAPEGGGAAPVKHINEQRREHKRSADEVQDIAASRHQQQSKTPSGISDEERRCLSDAMRLLENDSERDLKMKEMLQELPTAVDGPSGQTATSVHNDLQREEKTNRVLASQIKSLLARDASGALSNDEVVLLHKLADQLRRQQEQGEMREAQITWLRAETRRARITELLEARKQLERVHNDCARMARLQLPFTPIPSVEDNSSIALDWMQPASGLAVRYHLQWRIEGESKWTSSKASEHIAVPCCTKGNLDAAAKYEFRVRAADNEGSWGPWSEATEPTATNMVLKAVPSRPNARSGSKRCALVKWTGPELGGKKVVAFELQWRRCDGAWGEPDSTLESTIPEASTPPLEPGKHYTFRVRALLQRSRGKEWTAFGPLSSPIQIPSKPGNALKDIPVKPLSLRQPTADDGETIIAEQIREVARNTSHPEVLAAADATLKQATQKKAEDVDNLKALEDRHRKLLTQGREEQLKELASIKQKHSAVHMANKNIAEEPMWAEKDQYQNGQGHVAPAASASTVPSNVVPGSNGQKSNAVDTWD